MSNGNVSTSKSGIILTITLSLIASGGFQTVWQSFFGDAAAAEKRHSKEIKEVRDECATRFTTVNGDLNDTRNLITLELQSINSTYENQKSDLDQIKKENTEIIRLLYTVSARLNVYHGTDGRGRSGERN